MIKDYCTISNNCPEYLKFVVSFLIDSGMRPREIFRIPKSKLIYMDGLVKYVQPKTQRLRVIKLHKRVLRDMRYWHKIRGNFSRNFRNYKDLKRQILEHIQPKYKAKNSNTKLYYFRYLYVLDKIKKNKSPEEIAYLLGHNDLATVKDYIQHAMDIENQHKRRRRENG